MKTEEQIKEKAIEIQGELITLVESVNTFESLFGRLPSEEESDELMERISMLGMQEDILNWVME
jgi:hypothetical protein